MAWALVFAMIAWLLILPSRRGGKLIVPAILLLGILPDADIFLGSIGIVHRTITHSFFFWIVLFVPIFVIFRLKSVPYFVAVIQHFAFGDLIMGQVMIFWPFKKSYFGLNFGMPSTVDVALETVGLLLAFIIIVYSRDLKRLFSVDKNNTLMVLPLLALITAVLFFVSHSSIDSLITYVFSSKLLIILAVAHLILIAGLAASTIQGLRALTRKLNGAHPKSLPKMLL